MPGVKYKVTVTLSINLCTQYWEGCPVAVLFENAEYCDLFTLDRGESTFAAVL